jgi:hypothetical protein
MRSKPAHFTQELGSNHTALALNSRALCRAQLALELVELKNGFG